MSACTGKDCTHPECRGTGMHKPSCRSRRCKGCIPALRLSEYRSVIGPLGLSVDIEDHANAR